MNYNFWGLDITMCFGKDCPIKNDCIRYVAKPEKYQSYFEESPYNNGKCTCYKEILNNMKLHRQLSIQAQVIEEAEKYQKERDNIIADNKKLHCEVDNIKTEYNKKEFKMEWKYTNSLFLWYIYVEMYNMIGGIIYGKKI